MKVTVIGAGAVGSTAADVIARREVADEVVLLDIKDGYAQGKAMVLMQTSSILRQIGPGSIPCSCMAFFRFVRYHLLELRSS